MYSNNTILRYKTFPYFVKEHREILDYLYYKIIRDVNEKISKEDFYYFAFQNSSLDFRLANIYKTHNE
jgi:hypothetical protein